MKEEITLSIDKKRLQDAQKFNLNLEEILELAILDKINKLSTTTSTSTTTTNSKSTRDVPITTYYHQEDESINKLKK